MCKNLDGCYKKGTTGYWEAQSPCGYCGSPAVYFPTGFGGPIDPPYCQNCWDDPTKGETANRRAERQANLILSKIAELDKEVV